MRMASSYRAASFRPVSSRPAPGTVLDLPPRCLPLTAPNSSREFWDRTYESREATQVAEDELVGTSALAHFGSVEGKHLLDLGCGLGEYTLYFARRGARVTALDSSTTATERLRQVCQEAGLEDRVTPLTADAFDIAKLGPFDLVFGSMILHHLEPFAQFVQVLREAVAPGGRAFFYENSARAAPRSSGCVTTWPAGTGSRSSGTRRSSRSSPARSTSSDSVFKVEIAIPELFLARLGAIYLLKSKGYQTATKVDEALYKIEPLRKYSYRQMVLLS